MSIRLRLRPLLVALLALALPVLGLTATPAHAYMGGSDECNRPGHGPGGPWIQNTYIFGPASMRVCPSPVTDEQNGTAFGGYSGWETLAGKPIDAGKNTRDRTGKPLAFGENGTGLIHMDFRGAAKDGLVNQPIRFQQSLGENVWVTFDAEVGDPLYTDSKHVIRAEGQTFGTFVPTAKQKTRLIGGTLKVTDGQLTIDSVGGTNTKLISLRIYAKPFGPYDVQMNKTIFGPSTSKLAGYTTDFGQAFDARRGYGWLDASNKPFDVTKNGRQRGTTTKLGSTLMHMDYVDAGRGTAGKAKWELVIPNGVYSVRTGIGDPEYFDSGHRLVIEPDSSHAPGTCQLMEPSRTQATKVCDNVVVVANGRLTLDAPDGVNTKINFVEVYKARQ